MTSCKLRYDIHFVSDFYFVRQPSHRLKWQEDQTGDRWTLKSFTDKLIPPPPQSRNDK